MGHFELTFWHSVPGANVSPTECRLFQFQNGREKAKLLLQTMRTIDQLTDDCLALVFHRLEWQSRLRAESVCHRWNTVVSTSGWSLFHAFDNEDYLPKKPLTGVALLTLLTSFGATLREISLSIGVWEERREHMGGQRVDIRAALDLCPNIRHLRIRYSFSEDLQVHWIPPALRGKLVTLELVQCLSVSSVISSTCLLNTTSIDYRVEASPASTACSHIPHGSSRSE